MDTERAYVEVWLLLRVWFCGNVAFLLWFMPGVCMFEQVQQHPWNLAVSPTGTTFSTSGSLSVVRLRILFSLFRLAWFKVARSFRGSMDPPALSRRFSENGNHLKWRAPPNPCGPSSPQSPPPLVVRGKSLSLNKVKVQFPNGVRERAVKELSRNGRRQRLLLSQAGSLTLKRRETSPDFHPVELSRTKTKRGKWTQLYFHSFTVA